MARTYYDILGVANDASLESISEAYQAKLKALHDNHSLDRNQLTVLREVHQILSNPDKRQAYDLSLVRPATPRAAALVVEAADAPNPQLTWIKWLLALLIALLLAFWWHLKREKNPSNGKAPIILGAPQILSTSEQGSVPISLTAAPSTQAKGQELNAEQIFSQLQGSTAMIDVSNSQGQRLSIGSGVVIGTETVITNCHVTRGGSSIKVTVNKETYTARTDIEDFEFDLCRLNVRGLTANAVRLGQGQTLHVGQKVYAIGTPQGLDLTISDGIVSALREVPGGKVVQTTAPVSPGSSGGGLFDAWGNLVGIVTFQRRTGQNLNFAVPAEWIKEMRTRASSDSVGSWTMADSNEAERRAATDRTPTSKVAEVAKKILGKWSCQSAVTNSFLEINFLPGGDFIGTRNNKDFGGSYQIGEKSLRLVSADVYEGKLDDFTDTKFIINRGNGFRLVCQKN